MYLIREMAGVRNGGGAIIRDASLTLSEGRRKKIWWKHPELQNSLSKAHWGVPEPKWACRCRNGPVSVPTSSVWLEIALGKHGLRAATEGDLRTLQQDPGWVVTCPMVGGGGLWGTSEGHHRELFLKNNLFFFFFFWGFYNLRRCSKNLKRIYNF